MRARAGAIVAAAAVVVLLLLTQTGAGATSPEVSIQFSAYGPSQLDVLPGETVLWTNVSARAHTVTSDTGLFDSGDVTGGAHFSFRFTDVGTYAYHCTIHPSITGEIDVRRVILGPLPTAAVAVGTRVEFAGRTADPTLSVTIQTSKDGTSYTTIGSASPSADGSWKTTLPVELTGGYRAVSGADASEVRRLIVGIRRVRIRPTRTGIRVSVTPSTPYGKLLIETHRRERFGWWPVASGRLDYVSEAEIRVRAPARVRVVLVDTDGWTPIATSPVVVLRR